MTLDQQDIAAIVAALLPYVGLNMEVGTITDLADQSTTAISLTGLTGAPGDYKTMQVQSRTGPTRKRTIIDHQVALGTDNVTRVDILTLNVELGAVPVGGSSPDQFIIC